MQKLLKKKFLPIVVVLLVVLVLLGRSNQVSTSSTTEKTKTSENKWQAQVPKDIPIMPETKILFVAGEDNNRTISCQATKQEIKKDEVFSFYKTELVKQGWTITKEELYALKATKGNKQLGIVPAMTNKDGLLIFNIGIKTN